MIRLYQTRPSIPSFRGAAPPPRRSRGVATRRPDRAGHGAAAIGAAMGDIVDIRIARLRLDRRDEHLAAAMRARDDEPRKRREGRGRNGVAAHGAILLR